MSQSGDNTDAQQTRQRLLEDLSAKTAHVFAAIAGDGAIHPHEQLPFARSNMVRLQRALSWLARENELSGPDPDITFIMHWIAFESLYGTDEEQVSGEASLSASKRIMHYIHLLELVEDDRLRLVRVVKKVWASVNQLFGNQFIDPSSWHKYYQGTTRAGRKHNPFVAPAKPLRQAALGDPRQFDQFLKDMFSRLYMLRNQLFHGNASHKGGSESKRSEQITHGAKVMYQLLPVLIEIMLDMLEHDPGKQVWGRVPYPRIAAA